MCFCSVTNLQPSQPRNQMQLSTMQPHLPAAAALRARLPPDLPLGALTLAFASVIARNSLLTLL